MRWQVWVHEGLVVGSIPLCEGGVDGPVIFCGLLLERARRREAVVEAGLEALDLVGVVRDVVAWPALRSRQRCQERQQTS